MDSCKRVLHLLSQTNDDNQLSTMAASTAFDVWFNTIREMHCVQPTLVELCQEPMLDTSFIPVPLLLGILILLFMPSGCETDRNLVDSLKDLPCLCSDLDADDMLLASEIELLQSMYPDSDSMTIRDDSTLDSTQNWKLISVIISNIDDVSILKSYKVYLELFIPAPNGFETDSTQIKSYPSSYPIIPFLKLESNGERAVSDRFGESMQIANEELRKRSFDLIGSCSLYQLISEAPSIISSAFTGNRPKLESIDKKVLVVPFVDLKVNTTDDTSTLSTSVSHGNHSMSSEQSQLATHPYWKRVYKYHDAKSNRFKSSSSEKSVLEGRRNLPAWNSRETFLEMIRDSEACIVTGETGAHITVYCYETFCYLLLNSCIIKYPYFLKVVEKQRRYLLIFAFYD